MNFNLTFFYEIENLTFNDENLSNKNLIQYFLVTSNSINMFISSILIIIGLIGNLTSMITFLYSKSNLPKIASSNFLILLTLVNIIYLCLYWYTSTLNRTIFYLSLKGKTNVLNSFNLIDKNVMMCKIVGFIKNMFRTLNVSILVIFSLERLLAVYYPVKMLHFKRNNSKLSYAIVGIVILKAILANLYIYHYSNLIQVTNSTSNFNRFSINPTNEKTYCSIPNNVFNSFLKFHSSMYMYIVVAYLFIFISLIAIIIKLQTQNRKNLKDKSSRVMIKSNDQTSINDLSKLNYQNQYVQVPLSISGSRV